MQSFPLEQSPCSIRRNEHPCQQRVQRVIMNALTASALLHAIRTRIPFPTRITTSKGIITHKITSPNRQTSYVHCPGFVQEPCSLLQPVLQIAIRIEKKVVFSHKTEEGYQYEFCIEELPSIRSCISAGPSYDRTYSAQSRRSLAARRAPNSRRSNSRRTERAISARASCYTFPLSSTSSRRSRRPRGQCPVARRRQDRPC